MLFKVSTNMQNCLLLRMGWHFKTLGVLVQVLLDMLSPGESKHICTPARFWGFFFAFLCSIFPSRQLCTLGGFPACPTLVTALCTRLSSEGWLLILKLLTISILISELHNVSAELIKPFPRSCRTYIFCMCVEFANHQNPTVLVQWE